MGALPFPKFEIQEENTQTLPDAQSAFHWRYVSLLVIWERQQELANNCVHGDVGTLEKGEGIAMAKEQVRCFPDSIDDMPRKKKP